MVHHFGREKVQRLIEWFPNIVVISVTFAYCVTTTVDYRFSEESGFSEVMLANLLLLCSKKAMDLVKFYLIPSLNRESTVLHLS